MGKYGLFLFSDNITQLEDYKKTLTDPAEILAVSERIAELKAKAEH